jgi:hypothetical protein
MQKSLQAAHPAADRRPAIWPWVLMPLVALALFFALRTVRHSTDNGQMGPDTEVPGDASAQ